MIEDLSPMRRATLRNPALLATYLTDLGNLRVLARRAETEILASDPSLNYRLQLARDRLLAGALIDAAVERRAPLGEEDLRRFFEENPRLFQRSARVRFRQISAKSREVAREIEERLRFGDPFEEVARQYSVHPSAERGGEMGWHEVDRLEPALRGAIAPLAAGERSPVIETGFGLQVVEVQEYVAPDVVPFEDVRDVVERRMRAVWREQITAELIEEAQTQARMNAEEVDALRAELDGLGSEALSPSATLER